MSPIVCQDKHKHKKHKHKKEKDKKEGSERKDKERSENKHKEDKKRKRKEEKDKKDKEDKNESERNSLRVFFENQNGQKLVPNVVELGKMPENGNAMLAIKDDRDHNRMVNGQSLSFRELDKVEKKEGKESNGCRNIVGVGGDCKNEYQIKISKVEDEKAKEEKDRIKKEEKRKRKEEKKKRKEQKKKENNDYSGKLPKLKEFNESLDGEFFPFLAIVNLQLSSKKSFYFVFAIIESYRNLHVRFVLCFYLIYFVYHFLSQRQQRSSL